MIPKTERLSADVLILGGGLAGCMGAVAAIKKGCTVILADKAWVGSSGESTFAAGDILYYDPEQDDMHEWLERWNKAGDSMFDPEWLEWYGKNGHELILMLASWGMEFEKTHRDASSASRDAATAKPWSSPATKCRRSSAASSKSSAWSSSTA